jgi:hypothetical protein
MSRVETARYSPSPQSGEFLENAQAGDGASGR